MPNKAHPFTSSEEILNLEPGDSAIILSGYIDKIDGIKSVSQGRKTLLKFVVNNGQGTRIRVLMWDDVATANAPKLAYYQKIYITMGSISAAHPSYIGTEDVVEVEYNVQEASTIKYLGILEGAGVITPDRFPEIPMEALRAHEGSTVSVVGFIRSSFVPVIYSSATHGGGCVVFDKHRLSVQIAYFKEHNELKVGTCVKLMGKLKYKQSKTMKDTREYFFEVPNMDHVVIIKDRTATEEEMALAVISATSKRYSSGEVPKAKRRGFIGDFRKENEPVNSQEDSKVDDSMGGT